MKKIKKYRLWLILCAALAVLSCLCAAAGGAVSRGSLWTGAEKAWAGESEARFAQVAVFLPKGEGITGDDVLNYRNTLSARLTEASLDAIYEGDLYRDSYYGYGELNLTGSRGSATVEVLAVGGDFFFFHPLVLKDGNYIREEDLMHDGIVLDEATAWRLFGGTDLSGMSITCGDKQLRVAGVVKLEDDFASLAARGDAPLAFVSYDFLYKNTQAAVEGMEFVLPDPVEEFAYNMVKDNLSNDSAEVVQVTGRMSLSGAVDTLRAFGRRSMGLVGIEYPYWENALRMREDVAALLWLLAALFGLGPAGAAVVFAVWGIRSACMRGKRVIVQKTAEALEEHREKAYQKQQEQKEGSSAEEGKTWQA